MKKIIVQANANIALIKYWGKRDGNLFLPTKSSLSVTLSALSTQTSISFNSCDFDEIVLNGRIVERVANNKLRRFLDLFRKKYGIRNCFKINTKNNFPTAAGLASSSSGFASLAFALNKVCNLNLEKKDLSILARQGSGSACRSIYGGFVLWEKGKSLDGSDSYARQLFDKNYWPEFCVLVLVLNDKQKKISSRDAMQITVNTCKIYKDWLQESEKNLLEMIDGIKSKDFTKVGSIAENDCLQMHKTMQESHPSINYLSDTTLQVIHEVKLLREKNVECYFTIDAGPNVKILCKKNNLNKINKYFENKDYIKKIITCSIGTGVLEL